MSCALKALSGSVIAVGILATLLAAVGVLVWATNLTGDALGIDHQGRGLIFLFYSSAIIGAVIGAYHCNRKTTEQ